MARPINMERSHGKCECEFLGSGRHTATGLLGTGTSLISENFQDSTGCLCRLLGKQGLAVGNNLANTAG